jgi:antitoxin ParD1/3/4
MCMGPLALGSGKMTHQAQNRLIQFGFGKVGQRSYTAAEVPMPTRNVSLTKELDQFVAAKVEAGLYANASEVMRTALRLLEREEREYEEKLAALREAISIGDASEDAEEGVFERIRLKYGLPRRADCA